MVNDDILNSYFPSPGLCRGTENSRCSRESSTTCFSDWREGRVFDAGSSFMTQLGVSDREQDFSLALSERAHRCAFRAVSICRPLRDAFQIIPHFSQQFCETCTWLPRSYSDLFCDGHRESEDNRTVHGRFHESSRVALPVRRGFHGSGSTQQA